nr:probable F-box protein At4g22030 [Tanacetum cinerariifolium]
MASNIDYVEELKTFSRLTPDNPTSSPRVYADHEVMEKLYVILKAVSDRVEMHKNIGEQRNAWNNLMLTSINTITLSAATVAGIAAAITTVPGKNGWSVELEEDMREITRVLEVKDKDDYLRLGDKALKLNKGLAIAGPLLTGLGAVGSASSPWAMALAVIGGAMASVVNTVQHGGQVGMVFEMYQSNAGFFKMMEESIESNLNERDVQRRENGEVFEMKVALQLGRSLSELRDVAASSARLGNDIGEFGSKLF